LVAEQEVIPRLVAVAQCDPERQAYTSPRWRRWSSAAR
jgi:hypothetical protein